MQKLTKFEEQYAKNVVDFFTEFIPKVTNGKVKIVNFGHWDNRTGSYSLTITWRENE